MNTYTDLAQEWPLEPVNRRMQHIQTLCLQKNMTMNQWFCLMVVRTTVILLRTAQSTLSEEVKSSTLNLILTQIWSM